VQFKLHTNLVANNNFVSYFCFFQLDIEEDDNDDEAAGGSDQEVGSKPQELYRPPKLVPAYYG